MPGRFTLEGVPEQHTFEALALPLLDQLYNSALADPGTGPS